MVKILSNLIDNAMDAAAEADGDKWIRVDCRQEGKEYVFEVENTGLDIRSEQMAKLFEYGFTTKSAEKGATRGAGLCIVQGVVKKHKGTIQVRSAAGITKFAVHLPIRSN